MNNQCVFCCCISTLFCLWMIWTQKQITLEPEVDLVPLEDDGTVFSADLKTSTDSANLSDRLTTTPRSQEEAALKRLAYQEKIKEESEMRLQNITEIKRQNSHKLPTKSAFGIKNSTSICEGTDELRCPARFKILEVSLRLANRYKIMSCLIQKSMSTLLQSSMCYLHSERRFLGAGRVLNQESYSKRFCEWKNELNLQSNGLQVLNRTGLRLTDQWIYLAIVRDPVDRFLSAFTDKCIRRPRRNSCNNCQANMTCFVQSEYTRLMDEGKKNRLDRSFEDRHFGPQNWYCDFRSYFNRYHIIRYVNKPDHLEAFLKQFVDLLRKQKVPESSIQYIVDQLKTGRTTNSTIQSETRRYFEELLLSSPFLMEYVLRMYYHDFRLFGFDMPLVEFDE